MAIPTKKASVPLQPLDYGKKWQARLAVRALVEQRRTVIEQLATEKMPRQGKVLEEGNG